MIRLTATRPNPTTWSVPVAWRKRKLSWRDDATWACTNGGSAQLVYTPSFSFIQQLYTGDDSKWRSSLGSHAGPRDTCPQAVGRAIRVRKARPQRRLQARPLISPNHTGTATQAHHLPSVSPEQQDTYSSWLRTFRLVNRDRHFGSCSL